MFYVRANSAMRVARYAVNFAFTKQARFWPKNNASITRMFHINSCLNSERQGKGVKNKKINEKKMESNYSLYPEEFDGYNVYDIEKEFNFMNDDSETLLLKNTPKLTEVKSKMNENVQIMRERKMIDDKGREATDSAEKVSDSESESDIENDAKPVRDSYSRRGSRFHNINLKELQVTYLSRRNEFIKKEIEEATIKNNIVLQHIAGVEFFGERGLYPKLIFFSHFIALSNSPISLSNIPLYKISHEDLMYWSPNPPNRTEVLAIYEKENIRSASLVEPIMPIKVICSGIKKRITMGNILHSASLGCPKLLLTSKATTNPWNIICIRNGGIDALTMNHKFNLSWEEIKKGIDVNDKILLLEVTEMKSRKDGGVRNLEPIHIPSVDLYKHNVWDSGDITLIILGDNFTSVTSEILEFCNIRKALRVDVGIRKEKIMPSALFSMVFFEIRRQWLSKNPGASRRTTTTTTTTKEKEEIFQV